MTKKLSRCAIAPIACLLALLLLSPQVILRAVYPRKYSDTVESCALTYGVPPQIIYAVIKTESNFRPDAVSSAGAVGLMQIMPNKSAVDWARAHKVPCPESGLLFSPRINLEIGCWYLSDGLRRFAEYKHATELALARYNAGMTRAKAWCPQDKDAPVIDNISFPGTRRYVRNIMERYERYCREESPSTER